MRALSALLRNPLFLRCYAGLPHRWINRVVAYGTGLRRPAWLVDFVLNYWVERAGIDLSDCEPRRYESFDDLFLRRLKPGVRPLGEGFISPVDATLMSYGLLDRVTALEVKGHTLSAERLANAKGDFVQMAPFYGGAYAVLFLSPEGYHHIHMPERGRLLEAYWIAGRYFPQNETALLHIPKVYERNERVVLRCSSDEGWEYLLVLVGASLVGGIHLQAIGAEQLRRLGRVALNMGYEKGDKIAHFSFGSTVVVLLPAAANRRIRPETTLRMGQPLTLTNAKNAEGPGR